MITTLLSALLSGVVPVPPTAACTDCHDAIATAWTSSLHAISLDDPLYVGMRAWAADDAGPAAAAACATCHSAPFVDGSGRTGAVTCAVCHQAVQEGPGPAGLAVDPTLPIRTAAPPGADVPHPVVADAGIADGQICLACHAELHNPAGVPLCTTGPESRAWEGDGSCTTCHMPGGSHAFPGAVPSLLADAATLSVSAGTETTVRVSNTGAGHALPTGPVLRQIVLEVRFLDGDGATVAEAPDRTFARVLADDAGNAPVPPWRATRVARDTRLGPGEVRTFTYPTPAGAAVAAARLVYHRAPPPVARRLNVADLPFMAPREMARAEAAVVRPEGQGQSPDRP